MSYYLSVQPIWVDAHRSVSTMFNEMSNATLYVADQEKAKKFYTEVIGFELFQDMPMGPSRWIEVGPKGSVTHMVLMQVDENSEHYRNVIGKSQGITFTVTDMAALVAALKAKGVKFNMEPETFPWGTFAQLQDDQGNGVGIWEAPKF
jgi:lactoylglutathione lyase